MTDANCDAQLQEPWHNEFWCEMHEVWYREHCLDCADEAADRAYDSQRDNNKESDDA
jgi:hypothetical protein